MYDFQGPFGDSTAVRPRIKIVGVADTGFDAAGVSSAGEAVVTGAPITFSCWVIGDNLNRLGCPVAVGYRNPSQIASRWSYELYTGSSSGSTFLRQRMSNGIGNREVTVSFDTAEVTGGQLFHWAGTWSTVGSSNNTSNSTQIMYVNGVERANTAGTLQRPELATTVINGGGFNRTSIGYNAATYLSVAGPNGGENYWDGRIGEVGIWNEVLTPAEILSLAKGFRCDQVRPDKLRLYMPLAGERQLVSGTDVKASLETAAGGNPRPFPANIHPYRFG